MLQRRSYDVKCLLSPELLASENQGSPRATLLVFGFLGGRRVTTSGERETKYFLPLFKITIGFKPRKFNDENCEDALRAAESTNVKYISQTLKKIEIVLWPTDLIFFFMQSSHLALIDTLMMAYTVEMMSVERVMSCIGRYTSVEPSRSEDHLQELPYDTEDAIVTWINKVRTGGLLCTC